MKFELPNLRNGPKQPNVYDGRGQTFFVGGGTKVSELLFALPMVKGDQLAVLSGGELSVLVRRTSGGRGGELVRTARGPREARGRRRGRPGLVHERDDPPG